MEEDPVCGSAHCVLAPYWVNQLRTEKFTRRTLRAKQVSPRGGDLEVEWKEADQIVELRGNAVVVAQGKIFYPTA